MDMDKTIACAVILAVGALLLSLVEPHNSIVGYLYGLVSGFTVSYIVFCIKNKATRGKP